MSITFTISIPFLLNCHATKQETLTLSRLCPISVSAEACVLYCEFCPLRGILAAIERNSFAISVKFGLSDGSDDQHLSINDRS